MSDCGDDGSGANRNLREDFMRNFMHDFVHDFMHDLGNKKTSFARLEISNMHFSMYVPNIKTLFRNYLNDVLCYRRILLKN